MTKRFRSSCLGICIIVVSVPSTIKIQILLSVSIQLHVRQYLLFIVLYKSIYRRI